MQKNLRISKKSSNFAGDFENLLRKRTRKKLRKRTRKKLRKRTRKKNKRKNKKIEKEEK